MRWLQPTTVKAKASKEVTASSMAPARRLRRGGMPARLTTTAAAGKPTIKTRVPKYKLAGVTQVVAKEPEAGFEKRRRQ
jgi:hypothetical protein